jgi:hypothetical protein
VALSKLDQKILARATPVDPQVNPQVNPSQAELF